MSSSHGSVSDYYHHNICGRTVMFTNLLTINNIKFDLTVNKNGSSKQYEIWGQKTTTSFDLLTITDTF